MALVRLMAAITAAFGVALSVLLLVFFRDPDMRLQGWTALAIAAVLLLALFVGSRRKRLLHRARVAYESGLLDYERCHLAKALAQLENAAILYGQAQDWEGQGLALMETGNCHHDAGHHDLAIQAFEKSLKLWERIPEGLRQDNTWRLMSNFAAALAAKGDLESAESYARRAIQQCESHHPGELELAQCRLVLAGVCRRNKAFGEAMKLTQGAREVFERRKDHMLWMALLELAKLHDDQDRFQQAGDLYKLSCELMIEQVGTKHVEVGRALERHGEMLARAGQRMDSAMILARAAGILDSID